MAVILQIYFIHALGERENVIFIFILAGTSGEYTYFQFCYFEEKLP